MPKVANFTVLPLLLASSLSVAAPAQQAIPAPAAPKLVTVEEAVSKALKTNPRIDSAKHEVMVTKHRINVAKAGYYPAVTLSASRGYESTRTDFIDQSKLHRQDNSVSIIQPLFSGFSTDASVEGQQHSLVAAQHRLHAVQEEVSLAAIEALLGVYLSDNLIKLAQENMDLHVRTLAKAERVYEIGGSSKGDIKLVEARLALAEATHAQFVNELARAKATYERVTGEPISGRPAVPKIPGKYLPGSFNTAWTVTKVTSPILRAAQSNIDSAQSGVVEARSKLFPTLDLEVTASSNANLDGVKGENKDRMVMLTATYNIFNGGADLAAMNEARTLAESASTTLSQTNRTLKEQLEQDWSLWSISNARLHTLKAHADASREVLKFYQNEFRLGKRQIINLLDQENEVFQSAVDLKRGEVDLVKSAYRLLASMGQLNKQLARG